MQKNRIIASGMIGNALEFYDFTLYGFLAPLISLKFFPSNNLNSALIGTLGIFAIGSLMRPLGAIIFGYIGDNFGRKKALSLSITLMSIPSFIISILPEYTEIGVLSPFILVFCRCLQGLCTGGEYNGAAIYVMEHHSKNLGFIGGLIASSCSMGALLGTGVALLFSQDFMPSWAWRIPFFLGTIIGLVGAYIRIYLRETPLFKQLIQPSDKIKKISLFKIIKDHPWSIITIVGITCLNGSAYYTCSVYTGLHLSTQLGWSLNETLPLSSLAALIYTVIAPLSGGLADKYGAQRIMKLFSFIIIICSYFIFALINSNNIFLIIIGQSFLASMSAFFLGPINLLMLQLYPTNRRYTGISFSFSLGMGIFGGSSPLIMTTLSKNENSLILLSLWISICALVGFISINFVYIKAIKHLHNYKLKSYAHIL